MTSRSRRALSSLSLALAVVLAGCDPLSLASLFDSAETGVSVLTLLETDDRELRLGDDVRSALSASDYVAVDGSYLEAWRLDGREGQTYSIDLVSDDFDSYLYVVGPGLSGTLQDDDSGGACHARVDFTVLESGEFRVVASSRGSDETGTFRLRVSESPGERPAVSCGGVDGRALTALDTSGRSVRTGETVYGRLTGSEVSIQEDRPVQAWSIDGEAGETVSIQLDSDDYDAYLYFFGPGLTETLTDDDGGGDLNAELTVTFPETGTYTIGAGALSSGSVGAYSLTITEPVELADLPTDGRVLLVGSSETGALTRSDPVLQGRVVQAWAFEARRGDRVTFELLSDDFDSFLHVVGPGLDETDDDGGNELDSRLSVLFPEDGTYRVITSALGGETGTFTVQVR